MSTNNTYIVTGTLTDDHTVTLDEALPLTPMKVRLVVEPFRSVPQRPYTGFRCVLSRFRLRLLLSLY